MVSCQLSMPPPRLAGWTRNGACTEGSPGEDGPGYAVLMGSLAAFFTWVWPLGRSATWAWSALARKTSLAWRLRCMPCSRQVATHAGQRKHRVLLRTDRQAPSANLSGCLEIYDEVHGAGNLRIFRQAPCFENVKSGQKTFPKDQ